MAKRRIRRPKSQEEMYKKLTSSDYPTGVFDSYKDVFILAGVVGYRSGKRKPFKDSAEQISWTVFNLETDLTVISSIALLEERDLNVLKDDDESHDKKLTIFEEYAAAGLELVYEAVTKSPQNPENSFYEFIYESKSEMTEKEKNLKDIFSELGGGLSW